MCSFFAQASSLAPLLRFSPAPPSSRKCVNPPNSMDIDKTLERIKQVKGLRWLNRLRKRTEEIPEWVSTFHPERLPCQMEGDELYGGFNLCQKVVFTNNEAWIIRFPIAAKRVRHT